MTRSRPFRSLGRLSALLAAAAVLAGFPGCSETLPAAPSFHDVVFDPSLGIDRSRMMRLESGVYIQVLKQGIGGEQVEADDVVQATFHMWLPDATLIRHAINWPVDVGGTIQGFRAGVEGMRRAEERLIVVPPSLAYGARGAGQIPDNAWLVFRVTMNRINPD